MVSCDTKRCPPTPFDINRLHHFVAVTAEVASSSLVVPAIHSKRVEQISPKPMRVQKGAFLHPFCTSFRRLKPVTHALVQDSASLMAGATQFASDANTRSSTAACAARFAGEIACV